MLNIFKPKLPPNFELIELENVCRICLHSAANLLSLFNNEIDYLISEFLPQKLNRKPLQPHQICAKCFEEAKNAFIFKKQCQYSDELIKSMLNEPNISGTYEKQTQTDFSNFTYPCEKCEKKFESLEILREHRLKEHYKTPNICRRCDKVFTKIGTLRDHLSSAHPELGFLCNNKCHLCEKIFTRKDHLKRHLINIHKGNAKLKIKKKEINIGEDCPTNLKCQICGKFFTKNDNLRKHLFYVHNINQNFTAKDVIINDPIKEKCSKFVKIGKYEFSCEYCSENFEIEDDLRNHNCTTFPNEKILEVNCSNGLLLNDCDKLEIDPVYEKNSEGDSVFEDNLKTDEEDEESTNGKNEEVVAEVKSENLIAKESKVTQEIVRTNITESKKKITRTKVKPNENGRYECETCKKVFTRAAHLTRHQLLHSGDPKPYACTMCSKSFSRSDHLKNHVNGFHADLRPFKCLTCQKAFTRNEHLKRHMNLLTCSTEKKRRRKEKLFSCELCMRKFSTEKYVQDHIAVQHNETKEFSCKYCSEKIIGATEYKRHCKGHYTAPAKQFLCSECGGSFTKLQYLMIHIRRHTGEKPYKCRYCDKAFPRTTDQYAHERSHTGEKNFRCTNCPKAFSTAYKLRVHMRIHTGERPYKCLYCPKAFAQNNDLKAHHRRHTGERFYCDICGVGFVQMYVLRQHKRQVHDIDEPRGRTSLLDNREDQAPGEQILNSSSLRKTETLHEYSSTGQSNETDGNNGIKNEMIMDTKLLKLDSTEVLTGEVRYLTNK